MRYGSVCSGIEAATVAWHPLGWEPAFFSEIEAAPKAVLAHHWPDVPCHGDFTTIRGDEYGAIDLLVGGTPCQDFSVAGLRAGLDGDRGNLSLEFLRLADRTRPRWVVWENVPGVLSIDGGRAFGAILGGLGELGYGFAYRVLDAIYFGVAAYRRRVFVVGHLGDWRGPAAVLLDRQCLGAVEAPRPTRRDAHGCLSTGGVADRKNFDGSATLLVDNRGIRGTTPLEWERMLGFPDHYTDITQASPFASAATGAELGNPLRANPGGLRGPVGEAERALRAMRKRDEAASRGSLPPVGRGAGHSLPPVQHQAPCRGGHGLGDARVGLSGGRRGLADRPRYKALGNSMAVPVMAWIGQRIAAVDALMSERAAA